MLGISLNNSAPIYEQLINKIENLVLTGILEPNESLPSVRELATSLAVNPNTVQKAYTYLEQIGVTYSVSGKGRFVTGDVEVLRQRKVTDAYFELQKTVEKLKDLGENEKNVSEKVNSFYKEDKK